MVALPPPVARVGLLRRRGAAGVADIARRRLDIAWTALWWRPQLAAIGPGSRIRRPMLIRNPSGIVIGADCTIRDGARLEVLDRPGLPGGRIVIGDRVTIEQGVHIVACDEVRIGDDVCLAARVSVVDTTHPESAPGNRAASVSTDRTPVVIGDRAFVGIGAVVLPGVRIGPGCVIGANAVVTRDVPAGSVAAGVPARVLREVRA